MKRNNTLMKRIFRRRKYKPKKLKQHLAAEGTAISILPIIFLGLPFIVALIYVVKEYGFLGLIIGICSFCAFLYVVSILYRFIVQKRKEKNNFVENSVDEVKFEDRITKQEKIRKNQTSD